MSAFKKLAKEQVIDRIDPRTTRTSWKKIRNVSGVIFVIGSALLSPVCPFTLPVTLSNIVWATTVVTGAIAGRTALDKKGKK